MFKSANVEAQGAIFGDGIYIQEKYGSSGKFSAVMDYVVSKGCP